MLHHITQVIICLSNLFIRHLQHSFTILQCKTITLHTLKRLRTTNKSFYVLWLHFQYCTAVLNGSIKITNLFVTCCSVAVRLENERRLTLALTLERINAFGIMLNGTLKVGGFVGLIYFSL